MRQANSFSNNLETLLEREYDALLSGNLSAFEHLISEKAALLETVTTLPKTELGRVKAMRHRIARNQRLAQSAIKGMRAAIVRAKDIKDVSLGLRTYEKDGRNKLVSVRSGEELSKRS